jgi:hypothetical protein
MNESEKSEMSYRDEMYYEWAAQPIKQSVTLKEAYDYGFKTGSGMLPKTYTETPVKKEWVLVECVQSYRMRYMVEVPEGKSEWALDTVSMHQAKEFSQQDIGENIVSHRVISEADALKLCDEDNEYVRTWGDALKFQNFFTKEGDLAS